MAPRDASRSHRRPAALPSAVPSNSLGRLLFYQRRAYSVLQSLRQVVNFRILIHKVLQFRNQKLSVVKGGANSFESLISRLADLLATTLQTLQKKSECEIR